MTGAADDGPGADAPPTATSSVAASPPDPDPAASTATGPLDGLEERLAVAERRTGLDRVTLALLGIVALGLVLRFWGLGSRVAHWDEARVLYWIVHYQETGHFAYRRIIHGPFVQLVNQLLFSLFGPSDWLARAPVALVGTMLPLSALLFREHLEDLETVLLGLFLAINPVLLYYSRFMRSDLFVAAFMFTAFGLVVRFYDTRRPRYLYASMVLVGLGFGAKENAIVYVLTWLGATALLADQALYRPRGTLRHGLDVLREQGGALRRRLARGPNDAWENAGASVLLGIGHLVGLVLVLGGTLVVLFAQRGAGMDGVLAAEPVVEDTTVGLWEAVTHPLRVPEMVTETVRYTGREFAQWFGHAEDPGCGKSSLVDGYLCFLGRFGEVLVSTSAVLVVFAVIGTVRERYARAPSRNLVLFFAYCGFVSVLGYPLGTDIFGAWLTVHALVPLAVPAAAGAGLFVRWTAEAAAVEDPVSAAVGGVVLLLSVAFIVQSAATGVYLQPTADDNVLVQYAQPRDDVRKSLSALADQPPAAENPDVVLYGGYFVDGEESSAWEPACAKWFNALPLPWYLQRYDATAACAENESELKALLTGDPPVVVMRQRDARTWRDDLADYEANHYWLRTSDTNTTIFVREDYAAGDPAVGGQNASAVDPGRAGRVAPDHPRLSPPTG